MHTLILRLRFPGACRRESIGMKRRRGNERIKQQAGEASVIFLQEWKRGARRTRIYRLCLLIALAVSVAGLFVYTYYILDSSIPSVIHVRADSAESLDLGIPAQGEITPVNSSAGSNIPEGAVTIDLGKSVTLQTGTESEYTMNVKLFGILPIKQVGIHVIADQELVPVGVPIGIYMETDGVLVIGTASFTGADGAEHSPAEHILRSGDYIRALNGTAIGDKDSFIAQIAECGGIAQTLTVERDGELTDVEVTPVQNAAGEYKLGIWVRDNAQGVGTMTYIDANGNFGALGHGITDVDTSTLMEMEDGTLYQTRIVSIRKGTNGEPGEMTGAIVYSDENILGDIDYNGTEGIFGTCDANALELADAEPLPIGLKQEIHKGDAQILCTVDGTTRYYDVEITGLHLDNDNVNRGISLTVTDPELLELTGGIVQGMSGAPIVQDGKLIGAVTHVLVQNSAKGYGIFIETMLAH